MRLDPLRVYADTSVFGGAFDEQFAEPSRRFLDQVQAGRLHLVTSAVVRDELEDAPPGVRALFAAVVDVSEVAGITVAAAELQQAYLQHGVVPARWGADALHVAIATVAGCPVLVSWNFRHIVNFRRIRLYNAVNALSGYADIAIHSPLEVLEDEEEAL